MDRNKSGDGMAYLIDGHNLIPKVHGLSLRDLDDEEQLIEMLQVFCQVQRASIEVYFDGAAAGSSGTRVHGCVKAHFVRKGFSADAAIIKRLQTLKKTARNWTVVTSDRRIQSEARACSSTVVPSEEFASRLTDVFLRRRGTANEKDYSQNQNDLEEWLRLFGDEGRGDPQFPRKKR
jgi:uncharacterized protein